MGLDPADDIGDAHAQALVAALANVRAVISDAHAQALVTALAKRG